MAEDSEAEAEVVDMVMVLEATDMAVVTLVVGLIAAIKADTVEDIPVEVEVEGEGMEQVIITAVKEEYVLLFKKECATEEKTVDFVTKPEEEVKV